jgi:hypothetical protein
MSQPRNVHYHLCYHHENLVLEEARVVVRMQWRKAKMKTWMLLMTKQQEGFSVLWMGF